MKNFYKQQIFKILLLSSLNLLSTLSAQSQIVYAIGTIFNSYERYLLKIDLATCSYCVVKPEIINYTTNPQFTILPDGSQLYYIGNLGIFRQEPPPSSDLIWSGNAGPVNLDGVLAPNGLVYVTTIEGQLYSYDPATNDLVFVGMVPAGGYCSSLYLLNGEVHGSWYPNAGGPYFDITINLSDPGSSTFNQSNPPYGSYMTELTWNGVNGMAFANTAGPGSIMFYNPNTNSTSTVCSFSAPFDLLTISTPPPGLAEFPCIDPCVTTDAGNFNNAGPYNGCNSIFFPGTTGYDLNPIEGINYILYTNPANPLGSTIATSTGSYFFYNAATMQTGVNYYVAAIAGNLSNSYVLLNDPCLDVSDSIIVQFKPRPSVSFSASPVDICPGGCQNITASFTGDPPFTLVGEVKVGNTVLSTFTESFTGNSGSFSVCIPANTPAGSIQVKATSLTDASCSCN